MNNLVCVRSGIKDILQKCNEWLKRLGEVFLMTKKGPCIVSDIKDLLGKSFTCLASQEGRLEKHKVYRIWCAESSYLMENPWRSRNSQTFDGVKFLLIGLNPLFLNPLVDMMATSKALDSFLLSFFLFLG